ncbi:hypothetical protein L1887_62335 [Cichorium endivia]|nr:hypothetical protein L1887_62335 [Cichorium endivia]
MRMTHNLVTNYGLHKKMDILRPKRATRDQMTRFHTDEYVDFSPPRHARDRARAHQRGARATSSARDCPAFDGLYEFCSISAGGSLAAATRLNSGESDVAINWAGRSASRQEARGERLLLRQRHCARHPRAAARPSARAVHRHRHPPRRRRRKRPSTPPTAS